MITSPHRLLPMASHGCSCCGPASRADTVQVDLAAGGVSTVTVTGVVPPEMVRRVIEATGYTVLS